MYINFLGLPYQRTTDCVTSATEIYCFPVLEAWGPRSGYWQGRLLLRIVTMNLSHAFSFFWWFASNFQHSLACRHITMVFSLCPILSQNVPLLQGHQSYWIRTQSHDLRVGGFPGGSVAKNPPAMQETQVQSLVRKVSLEEELATHSRILAWEIPWTESLVGYCSWGHKESDTSEHTRMHVTSFYLNYLFKYSHILRSWG